MPKLWTYASDSIPHDQDGADFVCDHPDCGLKWRDTGTNELEKVFTQSDTDRRS